MVLSWNRRSSEDRELKSILMPYLFLHDPISFFKDPARLPWHEVTTVDYYYLSVDAVTGPMTVSEGLPPGYGAPAT